MEKNIYFVRHGESESNADGIHRGSASLLNDTGEIQARIVAERVARLGVDAIIASPWPRARATAEAIAKRCGLSIEESDLFVERKRPSVLVGAWHHAEESRSVMKEIFDGYLMDDHRHSDEENLGDLRKRANAALDSLIAHPAERLCVVTHGIFLRVLFAAAMNRRFSGTDFRNLMGCLEASNTGVFHFKYGERFDVTTGNLDWRIMSWNDLSHLG